MAAEIAITCPKSEGDVDALARSIRDHLRETGIQYSVKWIHGSAAGGYFTGHRFTIIGEEQDHE
jgi:hypothetical protein